MKTSVIDPIQAAQLLEANSTKEVTHLPGMTLSRLSTPTGDVLLVQGSGDSFFHIS